MYAQILGLNIEQRASGLLNLGRPSRILNRLHGECISPFAPPAPFFCVRDNLEMRSPLWCPARWTMLGPIDYLSPVFADSCGTCS